MEPQWSLTDITMDIIDRVNYIRSELIKSRETCKKQEHMINALQDRLKEKTKKKDK